MNENKEEKKPIVKNTVPETYVGRCTGEQSYFSTFLSSPVEGDDEKYELRLPVPKNEEQAQDFYGKSTEELFAIAVRKLATDVDSAAKNILFRLDSSTGKFQGATPESHLAAQEFVDKWRPSVRTGITKAFAAMVAKLKEMKVLLPEDNPETEEELKMLVAERMAKKKK